MTDLNKEREAFEELPEFKYLLEMCEWDEVEQVYINNSGDIDFEHYADACNGGLTSFLSQQKIIGSLKAELEKAKAQAVPEGYVVVPRVATERFKEDLKQHLDELWLGAHGCDWDGFVSVNGIDPLKIYTLAIEAS